MSDDIRNAAADLLRSAEEAVRAAWSYFNEATSSDVEHAMLQVDSAVMQLQSAVDAHRNAQAFGKFHRVYIPVALDVQAILSQWTPRNRDGGG